LVAGLVAVGPAMARDDDHDHDRVRRAVEEGRMLPLRDILARAQAAYPGEVVETELEDERGVLVYEIKVVTPDGRLIKLHYDARTGELLKASGKERRK
jgi:uncharacterized membrane protein YkoI